MKPLFRGHIYYAVGEGEGEGRGGGGNKWCLTVTLFKPVILYAERRDRRKSPGVPGAAIAIFTDRRDRRIKSPIYLACHPHVRYRRSVSVPAISYFHLCELPINQDGLFYQITFENGG